MSRVIQHQVRLTGENSFLRLAESEGEEPTTHVSHWRVLLSPVGPGHAAFVTSELTDGEPTVYSDNIALARWLQEDIQGSMTPEYADPGIPVLDAEFSKSGDARAFWTETIESDEDMIDLTWYGFGEPIAVNAPVGGSPERPHGVLSCLVPADGAQVTMNGAVAVGRPWPTDIEGRASSTCCLAFSETWLLPFE